MSGQTIPYHLRQNKVVDRYAFTELLTKVDKSSPISEYTYVGFGGHSLEDFKHLHDRFALSTMISIESSSDVFKRQEFNKPYNCITIKNQTSGDFIDAHDWDKKTIIWLDYTKPNELSSQIKEFQQVLRKVDVWDIIKITLNAHAPAYGESRQGDPNDHLNRRRIEKLKNMLGEENLFPATLVTEEMMMAKKFPGALSLVLKHSSELALENFKDVYFQPLTCFSYADGQTMLTVSGIVLEKKCGENFLEETGIKM